MESNHMANIEVKGYVNKPETKVSSRGEFAKFTLAERQKQQDGTYTKVYYEVVDFSTPTPPEDGSYATVHGFVKFRKYTKDGVERESKDVVARSIEIAPPRAGAAAAPAGGDNYDPFGLDI